MSEYARTVGEQLARLRVTCGTHGPLANTELGAGLDGRLVCAYCAINQELAGGGGRDIDAGVDVEMANRHERELLDGGFRPASYTARCPR